MKQECRPCGLLRHLMERNWKMRIFKNFVRQFKKTCEIYDLSKHTRKQWMIWFVLIWFTFFLINFDTRSNRWHSKMYHLHHTKNVHWIRNSKLQYKEIVTLQFILFFCSMKHDQGCTSKMILKLPVLRLSHNITKRKALIHFQFIFQLQYLKLKWNGITIQDTILDKLFCIINCEISTVRVIVDEDQSSIKWKKTGPQNW